MNIPNIKSVIRNVIWWACASLIAIAILEYNAFLGLSTAVIGGIVLGILLFKSDHDG